LPDKHFKVDYGGKYKNNTGIDLQWDRHDKLDEMLEIIKQYKIVITMENNKDKYVDTYITEKIIHGLCTHVVPVYWGTDKVTEYFNKDSMIIYDGQNMDDVFNQIRFLMDNDDEWLKKVNVPVFPMTRTIDDIASDVKKRGII
jgi:alpha(1,3/1,4) fucosyltransferase